MKRKNNSQGQAAILIIFVIGMVGLLIGMSLSKTGFSESMMGRGAAGSTYAFYVANSGIEDAFHHIQENETTDTDVGGYGYPDPLTYQLTVDKGTATITISGTKNERLIESVGSFERYVRKLQVSTINISINPGFARAIQAAEGGVELEGRTKVIGNIFSNSFIKGTNNGHDGKTDCTDDQPASVTGVEGDVWAFDSIGKLNPTDNGPCIHGSAFSQHIYECRIIGPAYSDDPISFSSCPFEEECDPDINPECAAPEKQLLPDIGKDTLTQYLTDEGRTYSGSCEVGGVNDCSVPGSDGATPSIGDLVIEGNLTTDVPLLYITGPIWVQGNLYMESKQDIALDPEIGERSIILFVSGKIVADSNITFNSGGTKFLLLASDYNYDAADMCDDVNAAITISQNVESILFYAVNGCALVSANSQFDGSIIGKGVRIETNSTVGYDPLLKDAVFTLSKDSNWKISSFTEE